jgi:hypothetical protein
VEGFAVALAEVVQVREAIDLGRHRDARAAFDAAHLSGVPPQIRLDLRGLQAGFLACSLQHFAEFEALRILGCRWAKAAFGPPLPRNG